MAISPRLIRRRIKSVSNTKKITKAMELVSAAKMRRAVAAVQATRPYAHAAWRVINELAGKVDTALHPLLVHRPDAQKNLMIVFTSDRGLCAGFNSQLLRMVFEAQKSASIPFDFISVGKRGQDALRRRDLPIIATFNELRAAPTSVGIRTVIDVALQDFFAGAYRTLYLAFTDYQSALTQKPTIQQLLPFENVTPTENGGNKNENLAYEDIVFEPSPLRVLEFILPRLVETQTYQALLESIASEHASRMVAMRSATDAANDMLDDLTLTLNQARQAGITREIAEISAGKAALAR